MTIPGFNFRASVNIVMPCTIADLSSAVTAYGDTEMFIFRSGVIDKVPKEVVPRVRNCEQVMLLLVEP